jgi:LmbE family N-acetylglucosaminyl deacetylase
MYRLPVGGPDRPLRQLLVIGAHSDDGEIGCGGTVLRLVAENPRLAVTWVVLTASGSREKEARESAEALLEGADDVRVVIGGFRDGFLPYSGSAPKDLFENVKADVEPDLILTHQRNDLHQDHRTACELTWNTWRDHLILEYEVPKWDGDMGAPNVYLPLDAPVAARKVDHLMQHFASQRSKRWFTRELFDALMRIRGMECASETGIAEAFYARKLALQV